MRKIFLITCVFLWALFLFFFEKVAAPPLPSTPHFSSGVSASGISHALSSRRDQILADAEVQETMKRIEQDLPKYSQDGDIFFNREGSLPKKESGNYHEWTVMTPGSIDRGARRLIKGKGGELYFTQDHYGSFVRVK